MSNTLPAGKPKVATWLDAAPGRILVVDDQPSNLEIVAAVLGGFGHEIIPAEDGPTALKCVAAVPPDLILLDMLMPGMDGCAVCTQLKANPATQHIPVIFLSAAGDKAFIIRALDSGGVDYITKPFNQAELVSRVRTQLVLKMARDQLRQLAADKDELLGILAHDLKNFLGGMNISAELLHRQLEKYHDERARQLAENIFRTSGQSLAFVKRFLANTAADHRFAFSLSSVNLTEAIAEAGRQHKEAADQKNISIHTECLAAPVLAVADKNALEQVLDNLISNAVKFSPKGRKIFLSARLIEGYAECTVKDEGPGFTEEDRAGMFQRYSRLSARPTGGEPSTGLGLSIVQKLVSGMDGQLLCESSAGSGALFIIWLPKA